MKKPESLIDIIKHNIESDDQYSHVNTDISVDHNSDN